MSAQKPIQPNGNGTSPADVSEEQSRVDGQRALERMGLMSFERPRRNPYEDLEALSLSYRPRRAERKRIRSTPEVRNEAAIAREPGRSEELPCSAQDLEPLLL